jgi:hypothetical protein
MGSELFKKAPEAPKGAEAVDKARLGLLIGRIVRDASESCEGRIKNAKLPETLSANYESAKDLGLDECIRKRAGARAYEVHMASGDKGARHLDFCPAEYAESAYFAKDCGGFGVDESRLRAKFAGDLERYGIQKDLRALEKLAAMKCAAAWMAYGKENDKKVMELAALHGLSTEELRISASDAAVSLLLMEAEMDFNTMRRTQKHITHLREAYGLTGELEGRAAEAACEALVIQGNPCGAEKLAAAYGLATHVALAKEFQSRRSARRK